MRKLLLNGVVFLTLLAACGGQPAATPTATTTPAAETLLAAATTPAATATARSPFAAPTTETDNIPTATGEPVARSTLPAPATIVANAVAMPTPAADLPMPSTACIPGVLTPAQTEGPYYSENPPEDATLYEEGMAGTPITLTGYVFDQNCKQLPGARVDFWQADAAGQYDNQGYTLRGYQLTDGEGRYAVTTVIPGIYPGRARHIHVKVTAARGQTLTSQLYFPNEPGNASDRIFDPATLVKIETTATGQVGFFNFVIDAQ